MNLHEACIVLERQIKIGEIDAKEVVAWLKSFDDTFSNIEDLLQSSCSENN